MIGCANDQRVSLATFMMKGEAKHWWRTMKDTLVEQHDELPTWEIFLEMFRVNNLLPSVQEEKKLESLSWYKAT